MQNAQMSMPGQQVAVKLPEQRVVSLFYLHKMIQNRQIVNLKLDLAVLTKDKQTISLPLLLMQGHTHYIKQQWACVKWGDDVIIYALFDNLQFSDLKICLRVNEVKTALTATALIIPEIFFFFFMWVWQGFNLQYTQIGEMHHND